MMLHHYLQRYNDWSQAIGTHRCLVRKQLHLAGVIYWNEELVASQSGFCIKKQLAKFSEFWVGCSESGWRSTLIVLWKNFTHDFVREVGSTSLPNYDGKDSVKERLNKAQWYWFVISPILLSTSSGIHDFLHLNQTRGCGTSRWWFGSMGQYLRTIAPRTNGEGFALTCPLLKSRWWW